MAETSSRLPGFYDLSVEERASRVAEWAGLDETECSVLAGAGLAAERADQMIENVVGRYTLPLGIGANFQINGRDYLIPLVVEEPSVVAAVSYAAKLARDGGGFRTGCRPGGKRPSPGDRQARRPQGARRRSIAP